MWRYLQVRISYKLLNGNGQRTGPELVKVGTHVANGRAENQDIPVTKVVLMVEIEILIRHISPARDTGDTIKNGGLVMHALIAAAKIQYRVRDHAPGGCAHRVFWIVNSDLHIRMRSK